MTTKTFEQKTATFEQNLIKSHESDFEKIVNLCFLSNERYPIFSIIEQTKNSLDKVKKCLRNKFEEQVQKLLIRFIGDKLVSPSRKTLPLVHMTKHKTLLLTV